jgi:hypothetical protein
MENQTPFDVNAAINAWRSTLSQSSAFRTADLDELELHLRDAIRDLESRGLSQQEAFTIGIRRIGGVPALAAEFTRVNGRTQWVDRALWMLAGWVTLSAIQSSVTTAEVFPEIIRFAGFAQTLAFAALWLAPLLLVALVLTSMSLRRPALAAGTAKWFQSSMLPAVASFLVLLLPGVFRMLSAMIIVGVERTSKMLMEGHIVTLVMAGPEGARYIAATSLLRAVIGWIIVPALILILVKLRARSVRA